jgi:hypothetical protein
MYPAARRLDSLIRAYNGHTVFYMTWGRKYGGQQTVNGHSSPPFRDFFEMQDSLRTAYTAIAQELSAGLVPVGVAWARARTLDSLVDLWQSDNSHPTLKGSYLAACVFYAVLFEASPVGLPYTGGLTPQEALYFQEIAWGIVSGITNEQAPAITRQSEIVVAPNPFHDRTVIRVARGAFPRGDMTVTIRDASGRLVRRLTNRASPMASDVGLTWDGRNDRHVVVADGVYFLELAAARFPVRARLVVRH